MYADFGGANKKRGMTVKQVEQVGTGTHSPQSVLTVPSQLTTHISQFTCLAATRFRCTVQHNTITQLLYSNHIFAKEQQSEVFWYMAVEMMHIA